MKIINTKGKVFGLINLIDLLVLITILLVFAVIIFKFSGKFGISKTDSSTMEDISFVVKYQEDDKEITREFKKGDQLLSDEEVLNATIDDFEIKPSNVETIDSEGNIKIIEHPEKKDYFITIDAKVNKRLLTYKLGVQDIFSGGTFYLKTKTCYLKGTIIDMEVTN
jgi:hypothetical protein